MKSDAATKSAANKSAANKASAAMTAREVLDAFEKLADPATRSTLLKHGVTEPVLGVKIGDMKPLQKKIRKDHELALELYSTGISDAMYFAGLIADESRISQDELRAWVRAARSPLLAESAVAWIAADSPHGWVLGLEWIESAEELIAAAGWSALSSWLSVRPNEEIDEKKVTALLRRVLKEMKNAPDRVRHAMTGFILCVGAYLPDMTELAKATARALAKAGVSTGKVDAVAYIEKIEKMGRIGRKKKMARC